MKNLEEPYYINKLILTTYSYKNYRIPRFIEAEFITYVFIDESGIITKVKIGLN